MFEVTQEASFVLKEFLAKQKSKQAIRILLQAGWGGPKLGMALDEQQDNDITFTDRKIKYIVEKEFFDKAKPIRIDFVESIRGSGFKLTSNLPAGGGCCWLHSARQWIRK